MRPSNRAPGLALAAALLGTACNGPHHIRPFVPRVRDYHAGPYASREHNHGTPDGSIFEGSSGGFLEDNRATRVGDIVVVRIAESADASNTTSTSTHRQSTGHLGVGEMFGLVALLHSAFPGADTNSLMDFTSRMNFDGGGETARGGNLAATIAVRIVREMPNNDLYIEGTKVVMINGEEYHLYLSGVIRAVDVQRDNTVSSSRLADAQIEFSGRGDLDDSSQPGWLTRILNAINPF